LRKHIVLIFSIVSVGLLSTGLLFSGLNPAQSVNEDFRIQMEKSQIDSVSLLVSDSSIAYKDGVYEGTGWGYRPGLKVEVTVELGKIVDIVIVSHREVGRRFYQRAMDMVPAEIISQQKIAVDSVTGSTYTSLGIMQAVEKALKKAV